MAKRQPAINPVKTIGKSVIKANKGASNTTLHDRTATFGGAIGKMRGK